MRTTVVRRSVVLVGLCALAIVLAFSSTSAAQMTPYQTMVEYTGPGEHPVSVVVDKVGNVWVSLQPICQVRKYAPNWRELLRIDLVGDCSGDTGASGLAVDATGRLYAAVKGSDVTVRGVYEVSPSGGMSRIPGTDQILFPNSIAFDHHNGTMYVTDMERGAVWRVPRGGSAEVWAEGPVYEGIALFGPRLGANGIAVDRGEVVVSVSFPARVVRIPIRADDSAGEPTVLSLPPDPVANPALLFAIDDIALDVFGDVFVSAIAVGGIGRVAADGSAVQRVAMLPGAVVSLAFGTGKGSRKSLFVAMNPEFGGSFSGIVKIDAGVPGRPLP
jgi:sugar lactone lactonase YvrE